MKESGNDSLEALRLGAADTALLVIDYQEKLFAAMPEKARSRHLENVRVLLRAASRLAMPVVASEQYPKGIGPTLAEIRETCGDLQPIEKVEFSCCENDGVMEALAKVASTGRRKFLVAGMETHICVYQSVLGMLGRGLGVHVVTDGCLSRRKENWRLGLSLCEKAGATLTSTETALFQLLGRAGTPEFKELSKLIR